MTRVVVAAAVIERAGAYLVTERQRGVHLEGHWEFPGGKCEAGEALAACLARELREELNVVSSIGAEILSTTHDYGDRVVELHFFAVTIEGAPEPQQGQRMRWVPRAELGALTFPAADEALVSLLMAQTATP